MRISTEVAESFCMRRVRMSLSYSGEPETVVRNAAVKIRPDTAEVIYYLNTGPEGLGAWRFGSLSVSGPILRANGDLSALNSSVRWLELGRVPLSFVPIVSSHWPDNHVEGE